MGQWDFPGTQNEKIGAPTKHGLIDCFFRETKQTSLQNTSVWPKVVWISNSMTKGVYNAKMHEFALMSLTPEVSKYNQMLCVWARAGACYGSGIPKIMNI